jgi:hypothetical protein
VFSRTIFIFPSKICCFFFEERRELLRESHQRRHLKNTVIGGKISRDQYPGDREKDWH